VVATAPVAGYVVDESCEWGRMRAPEAVVRQSQIYRVDEG
jgi:hypothetical protein